MIPFHYGCSYIPVVLMSNETLFLRVLYDLKYQLRSYPKVTEESFGFMPIVILFSQYGVILRMCSARYIRAVNTIGTSFFCCSWFYTFGLALFDRHFFPLFLPWDSITIIFHGVDFLSVFVQLDDLATLGIASGAVFYRFMGPLCGVLFRVDF